MRTFLVPASRRIYQPVLDARFSTDKTLTPNVGFAPVLTRASAGWYWGSAASLQSAAINAARFDHDPSTSESLGLRVEPQRTNKVGNTNGRVTTLTPLGTNPPTVSVVSESTPFGSEVHRVVFPAGFAGRTVSKVEGASWATDGTSEASTIWMRGDPSRIVLRWTNITMFAVATGRTAGDWKECSIVAARGTAWASCFFEGYMTETPSVDETFDFAVMQVEAGANATTPILGAADTIRSGDVCSISGTDFSSMYRPGEGTVVLEFKAPDGQGSYQPASLYYDGSSSYLGFYRLSDNSWNFRFGDAGSNARVLDSSSGYVAGSPAKIAYAFSTSGASAASAVNGYLTQHSMGTLQTPTMLALLRRVTRNGVTGDGPYIGTISRLRYYREKLSDSQLQTLTTL